MDSDGTESARPWPRGGESQDSSPRMLQETNLRGHPLIDNRDGDLAGDKGNFNKDDCENLSYESCDYRLLSHSMG